MNIETMTTLESEKRELRQKIRDCNRSKDDAEFDGLRERFYQRFPEELRRDRAKQLRKSANDLREIAYGFYDEIEKESKSTGVPTPPLVLSVLQFAFELAKRRSFSMEDEAEKLDCEANAIDEVLSFKLSRLQAEKSMKAREIREKIVKDQRRNFCNP